MKKITLIPLLLFILLSINSLGQISVNISSPFQDTARICFGSNLQLVATVNGNTSPYTFQWYRNDSLIQVSYLAFSEQAFNNAYYKIKVTDSLQQTAVDSIYVIVNSLPLADAGLDQTFDCNSGNGQGGGAVWKSNYTYSWTPTYGVSNANIANPTFTPPFSTLYSLVVTDSSSGCQSTDQKWVTVIPLQVNINPAVQGICQGNLAFITVEGNLLGATYMWSNGGLGRQIFVNPTLSTDYHVTVSNQFGCMATALASVIVNPKVDMSEVNYQMIYHGDTLSSPFYMCAGDTAKLLASEPYLYHYSWSDTYSNHNIVSGHLSNEVTIAPSATAAYNCVVSTMSNCQEFTTLNVNVIDGAAVDTIIKTLCTGDSIKLENVNFQSENATYLWSNGAQTSSIYVSPSSSTHYQQTITYYGCDKVVYYQVEVESQLPQITLSADPTICAANTTTLTASVSNADNYFWSTSVAGLSISVSPSITTSYTFFASNVCGMASDYNVVTIDTTCNLISGIVYYDANSNSLIDTADLPVRNLIINMSNNNYVTTNYLGEYKCYAHSGNYTVTPIAPTYIQNFTSIPSNYPISFNTSQNQSSLNNDFLVSGIYNCNLGVYISNTWPRKGFDMSVYVNLYSYQTISDASLLKYVHPKNFEFLNSSILPDSTVNDTLYFTLANSNSSYYNNIWFNYHIPDTVSMGYTTQAYAEVNSTSCVDNNLSNNQYTRPITVVASYDPNDISSATEKYYTPDMKSNNDSITYTIRFQNTGTDTAVNIRVLDTISSKLDMSTFEMLGASHPYSYTIKGTGIVEWKFLNIMLPDSTTNEARSHGLISYRIKPKSNFTYGDSIESTAHIYFDFNTPVATNTNVIYFEDQIIGVKHSESNQKLNLYPNPTKDLLFIETTKSGEYQIMDIAGKVIQSGKIIGNNNSIQTSGLSNGIYLFKFVSNEGASQKLFMKQ